MADVPHDVSDRWWWVALAVIAVVAFAALLM